MPTNDDAAVPRRPLTFVQALDRAVAEEMRSDPSIVVFGTLPPRGLAAEFGPERVRQSPISEAGWTGMAVGAAASGMRPIVMWRNVTFSFVAFDQVVNQAAKLRYMSGGQLRFPIVFRAHGAGGIRLAAQHSQSPYSIYAQFPGLKCIVPSSAADAAGLIKSAIRSDDPIISFEATRLDDLTDEFSDDVIEPIPLGAGLIKRPGSHVTVVAFAYMVHVAMEAAAKAAEQGIDVEVIDPRSVVPFDAEIIRASVRRTGRLIVVDEAPAQCSMAAEVAAVVAEDRQSWAALRAPVARVCGLPIPIPYSPPLEDAALPSVARTLSAIEAVLA